MGKNTIVRIIQDVRISEGQIIIWLIITGVPLILTGHSTLFNSIQQSYVRHRIVRRTAKSDTTPAELNP